MYYITFVGVVRWQNSETQNFEFKEVFSHISIVSLHCFSMQHLFQGIVHIKRIYFHWWYAKKNSFDSVGLVYKLHIFALKIYLWVECTLTFIFSEYWASSSECSVCKLLWKSRQFSLKSVTSYWEYLVLSLCCSGFTAAFEIRQNELGSCWLEHVRKNFCNFTAYLMQKRLKTWSGKAPTCHAEAASEYELIPKLMSFVIW